MTVCTYSSCICDLTIFIIDLLWWSFGAVTGAEVFGKDVMMPGGVSYLTLAVNTYQDTWDQWDSACSGGIYWIRSSKRGTTTLSTSFINS